MSPHVSYALNILSCREEKARKYPFLSKINVIVTARTSCRVVKLQVLSSPIHASGEITVVQI
jgi:hypothetical protein